MAVVVIGGLLGVSELTGQQTLADRVDRNAEVTRSGIDGIRCFLARLPSTPETPVTGDEIDKCFEVYDKLVEEELGGVSENS